MITKVICQMLLASVLLVLNNDHGVMAANKPFTSKTITVEPEGKQSTMTKPQGKQITMSKSELRSKYPDAYTLLERTEKVAADFRANGGGPVPLGCTLNPGYIHCEGFGWFCNLWTGDLSVNCGRLPPFVPPPPTP